VRATVLAAAIVAATFCVATAALIGSGYVRIGGAGSHGNTPTRAYATEYVVVGVPDNCSTPNGTATATEFHGVNFTLQVEAWCSPGGGLLGGNASQVGGPVYDIQVPGNAGPTTWVYWYSPGESIGVGWDRSSGAELLVAET
jgi:hypothetical protein